MREVEGSDRSIGRFNGARESSQGKPFELPKFVHQPSGERVNRARERVERCSLAWRVLQQHMLDDGPHAMGQRV